MPISQMTDIQQGYTGVMILTVLFLAAGAVAIATNRTIGRKERRLFLETTLALVAICVIDWYTSVFDGVAGASPELHLAFTTLLFAAAPIIPVAIAHVVFPERIADAVAMSVLTLHVAFEVVNISGGYVFWIDDANLYHRGPLYPVYPAMYLAGGVYLVVESIRGGRRYQSNNIPAIIAILVCLFVGVGIQIVLPKVHVSWTAVAMAVMLYFAYYCDLTLRCDALTKLLNRHSFDEFAGDPQLPCAIVVIDVDDFKAVNDTYGHAYGDECLMLVARCISVAYGGLGNCYRTGGDEFSVIVTKNLGWAQRCASTLRDALDDARRRDGRVPSVSVGAPVAIEEREGFAAAVEAADRAMYDAKQASKHR